MGTKIGIQLYTLREEMKQDPLKTLEQVAALGYEGVEFAGFFDIPAETMKAKLDELGLEVAGCHIGIEEIENSFETVVAYNKTIRNKYLICPWSNVKDQETLDALIQKVGKILPQLKACGMEFLYHNHDHELKTLGGKDYLEHLVEAFKGEIGLELDSFWVYRAELDPVDYMENHKEDIKLIHIKDGTKDSLKALGEGTAPIEAIRKQAMDMGLEWIIVENDEPAPTGYEDCKRSIAYLKTLEK